MSVALGAVSLSSMSSSLVPDSLHEHPVPEAMQPFCQGQFAAPFNALMDALKPLKADELRQMGIDSSRSFSEQNLNGCPELFEAVKKAQEKIAQALNKLVDSTATDLQLIVELTKKAEEASLNRTTDWQQRQWAMLVHGELRETKKISVVLQLARLEGKLRDNFHQVFSEFKPLADQFFVIAEEQGTSRWRDRIACLISYLRTHYLLDDTSLKDLGDANSLAVAQYSLDVALLKKSLCQSLRPFKALVGLIDVIGPDYQDFLERQWRTVEQHFTDYDPVPCAWPFILNLAIAVAAIEENKISRATSNKKFIVVQQNQVNHGEEKSPMESIDRDETDDANFVPQAFRRPQYPGGAIFLACETCKQIKQQFDFCVRHLDDNRLLLQEKCNDCVCRNHRCDACKNAHILSANRDCCKNDYFNKKRLLRAQDDPEFSAEYQWRAQGIAINKESSDVSTEPRGNSLHSCQCGQQGTHEAAGIYLCDACYRLNTASPAPSQHPQGAPESLTLVQTQQPLDMDRIRQSDEYRNVDAFVNALFPGVFAAAIVFPEMWFDLLPKCKIIPEKWSACLRTKYRGCLPREASLIRLIQTIFFYTIAYHDAALLPSVTSNPVASNLGFWWSLGIFGALASYNFVNVIP